MLPKEVDLLVSLVQSLRKVVLDLHLDVHSDASAEVAPAPRQSTSAVAAVFVDSSGRDAAERLPMRSASALRVGDQSGSSSSGGQEKSTLELLGASGGRGGGDGGNGSKGGGGGGAMGQNGGRMSRSMSSGSINESRCALRPSSRDLRWLITPATSDG